MFCICSRKGRYIDSITQKSLPSAGRVCGIFTQELVQKYLGLQRPSGGRSSPLPTISISKTILSHSLTMRPCPARPSSRPRPVSILNRPRFPAPQPRPGRLQGGRPRHRLGCLPGPSPHPRSVLTTPVAPGPSLWPPAPPHLGDAWWPPV